MADSKPMTAQDAVQEVKGVWDQPARGKAWEGLYQTLQHAVRGRAVQFGEEVTLALLAEPRVDEKLWYARLQVLLKFVGGGELEARGDGS